MSIYVLRTCSTAGDLTSTLCNRWKPSSGRIQRSRLELSCSLRNSLKTSHWNNLRWPGHNKVVDHFGGNYALSRLWKPFAFTLAISGGSMVGATIWEYENVRSNAILAATFKRLWNTTDLPKYGSLRESMNKWWQSLSTADKTFAPICAINVLVYLAWKVPVWQPVLTKYFTAGLTLHAMCWPMLFSVFSHYNLFHLAANMFVLHSFSNSAIHALGREQFVAVYLTAGMVSSFTSLLFKAIIKSPNGSMGASGAIMGILAYVCSKYPKSQLNVIFLHNYPFEAETGLMGLLCLDTVGCLMRWAIFDHAAHLGGALFGIAWFHWGHEYVWKVMQEPLISLWHRVRGPIR